LLSFSTQNSICFPKMFSQFQHPTEQKPGYLYQPESGAEPVKKGGVLFRTGTNPVGGSSLDLGQYCTVQNRKLDKSKISRGGSLFLIIFKLWYQMTPLTGKLRHERPPLPPQICLPLRGSPFSASQRRICRSRASCR